MELLLSPSTDPFFRLSRRCAYFCRPAREPAAVLRRPDFRCLAVLEEQLRFFIEVGELLDIAAFGFGISRQVAQPLFFRPAARHRESAVWIARGHNAGQHPASLMMRFFYEWRRCFAK